MSILQAGAWRGVRSKPARSLAQRRYADDFVLPLTVPGKCQMRGVSWPSLGQGSQPMFLYFTQIRAWPLAALLLFMLAGCAGAPRSPDVATDTASDALAGRRA
ncbi:TPA: hypothetical protein QEF71_004109 [Stenotrophomonas maltophilia]|nr:hypothetical protein [Stenotrophomonas maltophilia]